MRFNVSILLFILLISCGQENKSNPENTNVIQDAKDTILIKQQNVLNKSYEVGFYSKSFSYYWVTGKDTIDFFMNVAEYEKDSTCSINIHHKKSLLFKTTLERINQSLPIIRNDFDITKLRSLYFKSPIYYLDLTNELMNEYEKKFGKKGISYQDLNDFLLSSSLNTRLNSFLHPFNKKVKRYSIEKFQLVDKKNFNSYLPHTDLTDYPEFAIGGMGLSVQLENIK
jgi:hypothetical protein